MLDDLNASFEARKTILVVVIVWNCAVQRFKLARYCLDVALWYFLLQDAGKFDIGVVLLFASLTVVTLTRELAAIRL